MNDELLKVLDFDDLPPSTVDLAAAVRTGRFRERRNRALTVTAVAAMVLVVATGVALAVEHRPPPRPAEPPPQPWQCVPQQTTAQQHIVDPTGTIVVGGEKGSQIVMTTRDGSPRVITGLPGYHPDPRRVSSTGVIVGESAEGSTTFGWRWRDGEVANLPTAANAQRVQVWGVNARGDAVGWSRRPTPEGTPAGDDLLLWPAATPGTYQVLSVPGGRDPGAAAIRDDGTVLGVAIFPDGLDGVVWRPDGTAERLRRPGSNILGYDGDWVFGNLAAASGLKGFRLNLRTRAFVDLGTFDPGWALADGRLLGARGRTPAIWHDGAVELLSPPPGLTVGENRSGGGRTVYGVSGEGPGLVWHC